ncbi:glycosyltransferase [Methylocapsa polymorpha]|uniref:Glycosyltransferase n=1 Tax=Methylocapsa polymorpha TaxID=3080828 RepID=A0ABZ0HU15_9HYPH|nr:glycosyltransferase [Methylocapsa sp. RX1]
MKSALKIGVGFATAGRRDILTEALRELARQTRLPDGVIICPAADADYDPALAAGLPYPILVAKGPRGLAAQRNAILNVAQDYAILVFFDDDFLASPSYLAELELCFAAQPSVVALSGRVIADGIMGPGLSVAAARAALSAFDDPSPVEPITDQYNAYGCNMALRLAPIHAYGLRFDENLPLYSWLEDVDFCRRLAPYGRIAKNARMIGVHLGVKGGRTSGVRFGYSQVANPFYLWRKGSFRFDLAARQMGRNLLANFSKLLRPEPWVDRGGRARGNALAFLDLIRGRLDPRRILELD